MSMPVGTKRKTHCKNGHERTPENVHKNGTCKTCQKERLAAYNKKHPEKMKAIGDRWRANNPEKARGKVAKWRENNGEKEKASAALYRQNNPEKLYVKGVRWRGKNQDKVKLSIAKWKAENRDRVLDHNRQRRAKIAGVSVENFSSVDIFERDGWKCGICGDHVDKTLSFPSPYSASLDHVIPISKGGSHSASNTQLAHLRCNMAKNNRLISKVA